MAKQRYKKIHAGRLVREIVWTPVFGGSSYAERAGRQRATTAARRKINLRKSSEQLAYLLAANFTRRDSVLVMTFNNDSLPPSRTEARKIMKKFLAKLRQLLRSRGQELKYVYALEGKHGGKRLHFHMVLSVPVSARAELVALWPYGYVHSEALDEHSYRELGRYLTKEARQGDARVGAHSWAASRNLTKPEASPTEWVPENMRLEPPANAHILERDEHINEYGHFFYVEYLLPGLPPKRIKPPYYSSGSSV